MHLEIMLLVVGGNVFMLYRIHLETFLLYWNMRCEVMLLKERGNVSVLSAPALWGYLLYCNMHRE